MSVYTHGGDILTAQQHYHGKILDFSANINLLGMPERVRRAAEAAAAGAIHYPDPHCRRLTAGLAERDQTRPDYILCGNGAADLIFRLAFAERPGRALVTAPTFSEYEQALTAAGCAVQRHRLTAEDAFAVTGRLLEELNEPLDMVFLCNPNNPTGRPIDPALLARILALCAQKGIRLVVDECFLELTDGGPEQGLTDRLEEYPNLLLLRAFTKSYAMPGLRLGYCLTSDRGLLERLSFCAQPWSVSAPAQAAGLAALEEPDFPARARTLIRAERGWLETELARLGMTVFPSAANYILFQAPGMEHLKERLVERGILIRSCANYIGLGADYYRVAVRTHAENESLIQTLREVL